jgi:glycosyltransferase involved in cell wall biosynthesis
MHRDVSVAVVIPCYNEEEGVRSVIESLPDIVDEIVVVDNNSTDATADVARSLGAQVVEERTPGYGAAYKRGLREPQSDIIITMDGDGTYPVESIPELLDFLLDNGHDFVSAARFPLMDTQAMNLSNRVGNWVLTVATQLLFFRGLKDSQSGMWVFKRAVLPLLRLESDGMPFSEEIKVEAMRHKDVSFSEYHVPYHDRIGEVKLQKWRDGFENLWYLVKLRFRK